MPDFARGETDRTASPAQRSQRESQRTLARLSVLLAGVAGTVDAVGYLTLFSLFTAHMSGNSVALGLRLGDGHWAEALRYAIPIPPFVLGVTGALLVTELCRRRGMPYTTALPLSLEALLLATFALYGSRFLHGAIIEPPSGLAFELLVASLAGAMGVQTAALRRVGKRTIATTFVTGVLTNLSSETINALFWLVDHPPRPRRSGARPALREYPRNPALGQAALNAAIWVSYLLGAVLGGYLEVHWRLKAIGLPLGGLTLAILVDLRRPIQP